MILAPKVRICVFVIYACSLKKNCS